MILAFVALSRVWQEKLEGRIPSSGVLAESPGVGEDEDVVGSLPEAVDDAMEAAMAAQALLCLRYVETLS